jgi:hypothetical protein
MLPLQKQQRNQRDYTEGISLRFNVNPAPFCNPQDAGRW